MGEQHANGWRVSRHRLVADATVGVIANPMSGRDIRRLVASASVFPNAEKAGMVVRLTAATAALGVGRVLVSTDTFGRLPSSATAYGRTHPTPPRSAVRSTLSTCTPDCRFADGRLGPHSARGAHRSCCSRPRSRLPVGQGGAATIDH